MALNLDVSKLTQSAAMKATPHDNCIVLDLGTGSFPRDIEVRLPDDDGARQNALWDGSLNLAVDDEVLCFEYSGISAWRVMAMGGNDSGAGKARVSEIWESDFGDVALETDASGNVTINGSRSLTIPTDLIHAGDADTKWSFADDDIEATVGGLSMLKLTKAGQDLITLGPGSGDVDINFNNQMFLQGSDGLLSVPDGGITITDTFGSTNKYTLEREGKLQFTATGFGDRAYITSSSGNEIEMVTGTTTRSGIFGLTTFLTLGAGTVTIASKLFINNNTATTYGFTTETGAGGRGFQVITPDFVTSTTGSVMSMNMGGGSGNVASSLDAFTAGKSAAGDLILQNVSGGNVGTNVAVPLGKFHIDQPSTTAAIPTLYLDQADVSEEMIQFETTIGIGNAIEAVGAKTLTVTHFIKITLPGGLTRYLEAGTIA